MRSRVARWLCETADPARLPLDVESAHRCVCASARAWAKPGLGVDRRQHSSAPGQIGASDERCVPSQVGP